MTSPNLRTQEEFMRERPAPDLACLEWEQRVAHTARDMRTGCVQSLPLEEIEHELGLSATAVEQERS